MLLWYPALLSTVLRALNSNVSEGQRMMLNSNFPNVKTTKTRQSIQWTLRAKSSNIALSGLNHSYYQLISAFATFC